MSNTERNIDKFHIRVLFMVLPRETINKVISMALTLEYTLLSRDNNNLV